MIDSLVGFSYTASSMDDSLDQSQLHRLAIDAALNCQWDEAVKFNQELIETDPANVTCLNRLARALCELGQYKEAKKHYQEVIKIDPYNSIAQKNLKRIAVLKDTDGPNSNQIGAGSMMRHLSASSFLQEPGVTKLVTLVKTAEPQKLITLSSGTPVKLVPKSKSMAVVDEKNQYIGVLPDDIAFLMLKLINGGNKFDVIIKSSKPNSITVLIREIFRSKKFRNQPSFLEESNISSVSEGIGILASDRLDDRSEEEPEEQVN